MVRIILPGRPMTKKNHQRVIRAGNRPYIIQSKAYEEYEAICLWHLQRYKFQFEGKQVAVKALYWLPNRRGWPDLTGLLQATGDILERAQVIDNDRLIVSWDGSRIAGVDKEKPRAEIVIQEVG